MNFKETSPTSEIEKSAKPQDMSLSNDNVPLENKDNTLGNFAPKTEE